MTEASLVKELFVRPEAVRKGDFVLELTKGVESPAATARSYVVTEAIVDAFDRALGLVGSALTDGRSKGAYLHGSFGSGKSHFMAMLSLLLRGDENAWQKPKLHALRDKYRYAGEKKLLELHFHMIGKASLEAALLGQYVDYVQAAHPGAPTPALFADDALFENAQQMLAKVGEEAFFAQLNQDSPVDDDNWGEFEQSSHWDRARFEAASASGDPSIRAQLFDILTKTWFPAFTSHGAYLDLDAGLYELTRHAKTLGYDGVVLFLDELILWLAHRASEREWMHDQVQKMVKLVESEHSDRAIPVISFIARQRDLSEMVGDDYAGLDAKRLRDSLRHWEGRFDTITLEDSNLPAIVEERVLVKQEGSQQALDKAFADFKRQAGRDWQTLLGQWDEAAFRKLYPFSPALIDALVALSVYLQRERTSIRLLMELLVEHIEDLHVGEVVRVGDLFDVLMQGTDAADGPQRAHFQLAGELYKHKFLPLIQEQNGTKNSERCQRERPDRRVRLGCANCPEKMCRSDNRLIKTLLIAALVPNVPSLADLTASRLVALNHGSFRAPIKGTEAQQATAKLRNWHSQFTQVQVGKQADPSTRVLLESVDAVEILRRANELDDEGRRSRVLRELLIEMLGLPKDKAEVERNQEWSGTRRKGVVAFGNVRKLTDDQLRCPEDAAFKLVVDFPFDDPGHGPSEDEQRVVNLTELDAAGYTLVWLPHFFSAEVNALLGELTILTTMLTSSVYVQAYTSHLPVDQQVRARKDLDQLSLAKKSRLEAALEQAYGLRKAEDSDIDPSLRVERHLYLLKPGVTFQAPKPANLATALDVYLPALLDVRWPRHPDFKTALASRNLTKQLELFTRLVDSDNKELALERGELQEVAGLLKPLNVVQVTDRVVRLVPGTGRLVELENKRRQQGLEMPTVRQMRAFLDESGREGLEPEIEDLILRCYARLYARTFMLYDLPYEPKVGQEINGAVVLEKPPLPSEEEWRSALALVGQVFGYSLPGKALHADNLKTLETAVTARVIERASAASDLPGALGSWLNDFGVPADCARMKTARSASTLCAELTGKRGKNLVETLAGFRPETSGRAMAESLAHGKETVETLRNELVRGPLMRLLGDLKVAPGAEELLEQLRKVLRQDELHEVLADRVRQCAEAAQRLQRVEPAPTAPHVPGKKRLQQAVFSASTNRQEAAATLRRLADALESGETSELRGSLELWGREG